VRARRDELAFTQKYLAAAVGVSRQSLNAIETAGTLPNVALALRLASVLASSVEALFGGEANEELEATLGSHVRRAGTRVLVGSVRERWVAHPLHSEPSHYAADGFVRKVSAGRASIELARGARDLQDTLFLGGCAPGLSVLADRLDGGPTPCRYRWIMQSNPVALRALADGHCHIVGVHLPDDAPQRLARLVARHLPTESGALYAFARWEAGLVVAPGNPARLHDVKALERPKLRVALREAGSGAHVQLARMLRQQGLDIAQLSARSVATHSHMAVAQAVQLGAADVGFSIRAAAIAFGLDFVPLVEERFDLVVPGDLADDPRVARLREVLGSSSIRRELTELGYDARCSGECVGQVSAA
jgi:molybdate-binding protein/DNA-binding XRE family transcriptional regulator